MPQKTQNFYGLNWPAPEGRNWFVFELVQIELFCIRKGGKWVEKGREVGAGLFHHYKRLHELLWPSDFWTPWDTLILDEMINHRFIGIAGPASSGKTHRASTMMLCRYFAFPNNFTGICSTTTRDALNLRVFGEIKKYHSMAKIRCGGSDSWEIPGHLIESKQMITTDGKDSETREFRNGIVGVACIKGGTFEGLSNLIGIKNDHVMLLGDELPTMNASYLDACANLTANPWFQFVGCGNPKDTMDAFGQLCEPKEGWDNFHQGDKTQVWNTRFRNGRCVRLVGLDSPNLSFPEGKEPYKKIIGRRFIQETAETYGKDHWKYLCWVLAKFPIGVLERRVINRGMCVKFKAFEQAIWGSDKLTSVFGLDAAYGSVGGDRCMAVHAQFGRDREGKVLFSIVRSMMVPVPLDKNGLPEDHIVRFVKDYCETHQIDAANVFFDGTGRSSLTSSFGRMWSTSVNPVEFGGKATERPDPANPKKTCRDSYYNLVSEFWFSARVLIEHQQMRGMTESLVHEGQSRAWDVKKEQRVQVEPKPEMKERLGRSPDEFDALVVAIEGARRRGMVFGRMDGVAPNRSSQNLLKDLLRRQKELQKSHELSYAT